MFNLKKRLTFPVVGGRRQSQGQGQLGESAAGPSSTPKSPSPLASPALAAGPPPLYPLAHSCDRCRALELKADFRHELSSLVEARARRSREGSLSLPLLIDLDAALKAARGGCDFFLLLTSRLDFLTATRRTGTSARPSAPSATVIGGGSEPPLAATATPPRTVTDLELDLDVDFDGFWWQLKSRVSLSSEASGPASQRSQSLSRCEFSTYLTPDTADWLTLEPAALQEASVASEGKVLPGGAVFRPAPLFDVGSERALQEARIGLTRCRGSKDIDHDNCRSTQSHPRPRRLAEIIPSTSIAPHRIRIVESRNDVEYVALSYCWGGDQPKMTLRQRQLYKAAAGRPVTTLSQSVQDAVAVTLAMGFRFLWVDAICIVQDDPEDTAMEIDKMAGIYGGAVLTILAGGSASSATGFLHDRSDRLLFQLGIRDENGRRGSILLEWSDPRAIEPPDPVSLRGWTLQEVLMSRRILYFGRRHLEWICVAHDLFLPRTYPAFPARIDWYHVSHYTGPAGSRQADAHDAWSRIIGEYTRRALTYPSDKLVAISAIAQQFSVLASGDQKRPWRYLAGLWEETLAVDLLWTVHELRDSATGADSIEPRRPAAWRAPSWSWASVDGEVSGHRFQQSATLLPALKLVQGLVKPHSILAPFGGIVRAELLVRGKMRRVGVSSGLNAGLDSLILDLGEQAVMDSASWDERVVPNRAILRRRRPLWILEAARVTVNDNSGTGFGPDRLRRDVRCLMLQEQEEGRYLRIGLLMSIWAKDVEAWRATFEVRDVLLI